MNGEFQPNIKRQIYQTSHDSDWLFASLISICPSQLMGHYVNSSLLLYFFFIQVRPVLSYQFEQLEITVHSLLSINLFLLCPSLRSMKSVPIFAAVSVVFLAVFASTGEYDKRFQVHNIKVLNYGRTNHRTFPLKINAFKH